MIPDGADRDALRRRLIHEQHAGFWDRRPTSETADAILDADDLLVVDLRCPTCEGSGQTFDLRCDNCGASASLPLGQTCPNHLAKPLPCYSCNGTGRRDVRVVDADLLRKVARHYGPAELTDAEQAEIHRWAE